MFNTIFIKPFLAYFVRLAPCAFCAWLLLFNPACEAALPAPLLSDFTHTAWGRLQGAPVDVLKITQTSDGWLWIATATGLYRFDGMRFERVESVYGHRLLSNNVIGLMADSRNGLWVGYRVGGVSYFRPDESRTYAEAEGLPTGGVIHIEVGADGSVWLGTRDGAAFLAPGARRFKLLGANVGLPEKFVYQILLARDGTQWVGALQGLFFRKPGQTRFTQAWPRVRLLAIAEAPDGTIWARTPQYQYVRVMDHEPQGVIRPAFSGMGMRFGVDRTMWVLHPDGIERKFGSQGLGFPNQLLTQKLGMSGPQAQCFFQDREENIWIGTATGLDMLRANRLKAIVPTLPLEDPGVAQHPNGTMLISGAVSKVKKYTPNGLSSMDITGIISTSYREGKKLYFGTDTGIYKLDDDNRLLEISAPEAEKGFYPQSIVVDDDHTLWVSYSSGLLYRRKNNHWENIDHIYNVKSGLIISMSKSHNGDLWLGFSDNRIMVIPKHGGVANVSKLNINFNLGAILHLESENDVMWIAAERGVALYKSGQFLRLTGTGDEFFKGASGIVKLANGDVWLHGADGIFHIPQVEMEKWLRQSTYRVAFEFFDAHDGLIGHAQQLRPLPSMIETKAGDLWFITNSGIFSLDPAHVLRNSAAPPVFIRSITINGKKRPVSNQVVELPEGTNDFGIEFTALSFRVPDRVKFRYQLVGVDKEWQGPIERREAFYTNLSPGEYQFQVTAANEDGLWNPAVQSVVVRIQPTFIQSIWFKLLLVTGVVLVIYFMHVLRVRTLTQRMQERLSERARIARALHDTLLQGIQGLIWSFRAHYELMPHDGDAHLHLEHTLKSAEQLLVEGRNEILDLRSAPGENALYSSLEEFGKAKAVGRPHTFSAHLLGRIRPINQCVYEELFSIGREAICNASRYSSAQKIELKISYAKDGLWMEICDDGCGLPDGDVDRVAGSEQWGLKGIRERAEKIEAKLKIQSEKGKGTTISLFVNKKSAYA